MAKKNKIKLTLTTIILLILISIAAAQTGKVLILNLDYDDGKITFKDKIIKIGYSPDMKIQPEEGYRLDVVSREDTLLYSFKFEVPLDVYVDAASADGKEMSGGLIRLDKADFALAIPYFEDAKEIKIYDERDTQQLGINVEEKAQKRSKLWIIMPIAAFILLLIALFLHKKRSYRKF